MAVICPAILAENPHTYRTQIERVTGLAKRIHVDLCDGDFAKTHTVTPQQLWWPDDVKADVHLMFKHPEKVLDKIINLRPNMIILHAEAEGDFFKIAKKLTRANIKVGLALLQLTRPEYIEKAINEVDHVLIFSGDLGSFGGRADLALLEKTKWLKSRRPDIELGWDGGINDQNAAQLAFGGIDILDVGGYIQRAQEPQTAYDKLIEVIQGNKNNGQTPNN